MRAELASIGLDVREPSRGMAGVLADFDAQIFGSEAWNEAMWRSTLSTSEAAVYACEDHRPALTPVTQMVGVGAVGLGPEAEILTIGVQRSWRGRGVGNNLLTLMLLRAVASGAEAVFLEVRSQNGAARRMYQQRGFIDVGLRRGYYGDDDAVVMRLDVSLDTLLCSGKGRLGGREHSIRN
ncbi:MAG: GNAT family N-acetyltransferase [Actinomycetaceae bacterium]|nr:GNAT family N-acetyltransferase [Actinomycetaceae bacterium]MDY6082876.1 GNAT family N-acetyltransferase [Actinomycetaceae bacterium]